MKNSEEVYKWLGKRINWAGMETRCWRNGKVAQLLKKSEVGDGLVIGG